MLKKQAGATTVCVALLLLYLGLPESTQGRPQQARPDSDYALERNYSNQRPGQPSCGYKSCPKTDPKRLNVHIVAHTHDDVGWLKTVDQYYYGTSKKYSQAGVQYIMDSVVPQLMMDKSKRFIYVEMSFFSKWWEEQDEQMKSMVRHLVNEGRLEFINGGWCMNDEATVTYHSTIEQMTLGLRFLNETFGVCGHPKVGWQIDPFGHSSEQASLFAQFGYDGMFFTRISYLDKLHRAKNRSLDLIWHGDRALQGQSGSIFTNIFRDGYDSPNGYCFDALCLDDAIVDNKKSYEFNVEAKGESFINFIRQYSGAKLTNHLLIPFGGDFQFTAAGQNFKSMDKLMRYVRTHAPDIHIFYSTPSCYQFSVFESVMRPETEGHRQQHQRQQQQQQQQQRHINLPEKYDDFMPYDSSPTVWWSGYFASRPSVKLVERETADLLQVARLVSVAELLDMGKSLTGDRWIEEAKEHEEKCLGLLWEVLGDLQHHDAVTGTEKQHVADDYVRRASDARKLCAKFIGDSMRRKLDESLKLSTERYEMLRSSGKRFQLDPVYLEETMFCPLLNISQCDALESDVDFGRFLLNSTSPTLAAERAHLATLRKLSGGPSYKTTPLPKELETKSVLVTAYNPLARPVTQMDVRLPCNGRCDLDKVRVIHLATNETMKLIRLPAPAGVTTLPFRDAHTSYEMLFYINVPPLGRASFVISDENLDDIVDEETEPDDSVLVTDESQARSRAQSTTVRNRRIRRESAPPRYEYFEMGAYNSEQRAHKRYERDTASNRQLSASNQNHEQSDRVIVKFDMQSGVITGLKRVSDGSILNITQKFGYYFPADYGPRPGAYIFRPNSSEPHLLHKPTSFRMYKRQGGSLIEIHQKWADWIWQTIRVDARKNYMEFDYVVGPIPQAEGLGREVVTRYLTNMANEGVFLTDSNARQLLPRHRLRNDEDKLPTQLGGSFYPVTSTMIIRNNKPSKASKSAEAVSVLVDRAQAGTSLNEGDLELLIHRRQLADDNFGVSEALDEPGEDGRGLVTRGRHRLFLKFLDQSLTAPDLGSMNNRTEAMKRQGNHIFLAPSTPRANLTYEQKFATLFRNNSTMSPQDLDSETYFIYDQLLNDIRQESIKYALKPILTFDRLRVSASDLMQMFASDPHSRARQDTSLLNTTLPENVHLLTLQPWTSSGSNQLLIRLENLDNPLTLHPLPDIKAYSSLLEAYKTTYGNNSVQTDPEEPCHIQTSTRTKVNIEHLITGVRLTSLEELNLGANNKLADDKRLNWTQERPAGFTCDTSDPLSSISLGPRQIRTFLASYEIIPNNELKRPKGRTDEFASTHSQS